MIAKYDSIGQSYADLRVPDPRIGAAIMAAVGPADTIVNVGAGTGAYEPANRRITAVEPSQTMNARRPPSDAVVIQASAEALPFSDDSFDAAMAVLTVHHWQDKAAGFAEMRRVTRGRIVVVTFDPAHRPWLTDYIPELAGLDTRQMPALSDYAHWLGRVNVVPLLVPRDCTDGFLYAYWHRPEAYLDPHIRSGSSSFWELGEAATPGLDQLAADLTAGTWEQKYGHLADLDHYDAGYRLIVAG